MKWLYYLCTAALLSVALAGAQSLTGRWTGNFSTADNGLEIVVALNQAAMARSPATYSARAPRTPSPAARWRRATLTLEAERAGRGGATQKVTYTATVEGGKMKLTMPAPNFGGGGAGRGRGAPGGAPGAGGPPPGAGPGGPPGRRGRGPGGPAADAAASRRSSNWPASPTDVPAALPPSPNPSLCPCPPPP